MSSNSGAIQIKQHTQPPTHHSDYTLIQAMEQAGKHCSSIGTPATRADTIELLIERGYLKRHGNKLRSTLRGRSLVEQVPHWLKSPNTTSTWEAVLEKISTTMDEQTACRLRDQFIAQQRSHIIQLIDEQLLPMIEKSDTHQSTKPTDKMIHYAERIAYSKKVPLPPDYKTSRIHCGTFIAKHKNR